jgi:hypothetical protein
VSRLGVGRQFEIKLRFAQSLRSQTFYAVTNSIGSISVAGRHRYVGQKKSWDHHVRGSLPRAQQILLTFKIAAAVSWEVGKFADLSSEGDATMILIGFRHGLRVLETRGAPFGLWQGGP